MKKIILAVGAHPDDIDIRCAGAIAKWIQEGATAYYLILTDGSKGSEDPKISNQELTKLRHSEQQNSADLLGVKKVFFLDFIDGELENTHKLRKEIVKIIRQVKPTTVLTWDPTIIYDEKRQSVIHPDHRVAGQATLDSVFPFARNARTYMDLLEEGLKPHIVDDILLFNHIKPNYFVDITKTIDLKLQALGKHISQFRDMKKFQERIKLIDQELGKKIKVKYAEAYLRIQLRQPS